MGENNSPRWQPDSFSSIMTRRERLAALIYLPIHALILPMLISLAAIMLLHSTARLAELNFIYYAFGAVLMLILERKFLRREFDTLCEHPIRCLVMALLAYLLMMMLNSLVMYFLLMFVGDAVNTMSLDNPNNSAMLSMMDGNYGMISAMSIFIAPILEELLFRAGVFGTLRQRNRILAYAVTMLLFSLYHVWQSVLTDWTYLLFAVQYFPAAFILCWAYERTDTIWTPIFLHMFINFMAIRALEYLESAL